MPIKYGKDSNFKGKKNRSGRKNFPIEQARIRVIKKSWNILDNHLKENKNVNVALPIALKDMTEKKDVTSGGKPININFDSAFKNDSPSQTARDSSE